jgi:uncharacterized membrane protein YeaQ/YmgE (transglycosylase-associated protein family)
MQAPPTNRGAEVSMYLSNEGLLVVLVVGIVAGWLAARLVAGGGFGLIGDLILGVLGALIGDWLLPRFNLHLGTGMVAQIVNATIGAILLLLVIRILLPRRSLFGGSRGWGGGRWLGRW